MQPYAPSCRMMIRHFEGAKLSNERAHGCTALARTHAIGLAHAGGRGGPSDLERAELLAGSPSVT